MINLVKNKLPLCDRFYRSLYDQCMKARYTNYMVSDEMANMARKYLNYIKAHLNKVD